MKIAKTKTSPSPKSINEAMFDTLCQEICKCLTHFCQCMNNSEKTDCVGKFQKCLQEHLNSVCGPGWEIEYKKPNSPYSDRVDIFFKSPKSGYNWIIEIDASRADQVAKKAFSRFAIFGTGSKARNFFYVAIVYPGTNNMNINEVIKYSRYGHDIAKQMHRDNEWRTIIIDCENQCVKVLNFNNVQFMVNGSGSFPMNRAVEKAIKEYFIQSKSHTYQSLEKALLAYNRNHNGLQKIISLESLAKTPIKMQDGNGTEFYLTIQWAFSGESANFDDIIKFFKKFKIIIEPKWHTPCECL